jgi:hypothetical protein
MIVDLTEPAIQLVPKLAVKSAWEVQHIPVSSELSVHAKLLEDCGPSMWDILMQELRHIILTPKSLSDPLFRS